MPGLIRFTAISAALWAATTAAAPFAYVPNEGSASISIIDTATLKLGKKPRGIAVSLDGSRLFISDQTANALLTADLVKREVVATTALGSSPEAIYLSPDGKWLSAAIEEDDQVLLIDAASGTIAHRIKMRGKNPEHAVFSPDGKWLYVSSEEADSVDIVDRAGSASFPTAAARMSPPRTQTR